MMTKLKTKNTYHQKLSITGTLREELDSLLELSESEGAVALLIHCLDEADSLKQASLLKKVGSLVTGPDAEDCNPSGPQQKLCVRVLAELFIVCHAKNPARRTVASILGNLSGDCTATAQTSLTVAIRNKIDEGKQALLQNSGLSSFCVRDFTDLLSSLLENFQLGAHVVTLMGFPVVEFLGICLKRLVEESRAESTSVVRTSLMTDCLIYIKNIISVLQRCSQQPSSFHGYSCHGNKSGVSNTAPCTDLGQEESCVESFDVHSTQSEKWPSVLAAISEQLLMVLYEESFLPDCRSAAGMALPLIVRTTCEEKQLIPVIVKTFFVSYLRSDVTLLDVSSPPWLVNTMDKNPATDNASFTLLCLCHGTLTMLSRDALLSSSEVLSGSETGGPRSLLFDVLFPVLCDLCEGLKESSSCLAVFRTLALWTEEARAAATSQLPWLKTRLLGPAEIPQKLLGFVWSHWDHPIEGVRHNTRAIFDGVIKMHSALSQDHPSTDVFLKSLTESLIKVDWHMRGKYGPLCSVGSAVGARFMLEWYPDIPRDILRIVGDRSVAPHVIEFIETLTQLHKKDISSTGGDLDEWMQTWIIPVLENLRLGNRETRARLTEYCLPKLLKCFPESLPFIVERLRSQERGADASYLGSLITCLKTARTLGLIDASAKGYTMGPSNASAGELWAGLVPVELLQKCLCNVDDQIRLDALGLLCECPKSTEPVTEVDMRLLRIYLALNMNSQSPAFRQHAAASVRKLFFRFKECMRILKKDLRKEQSVSHKASRLSSYREFLHWFCELQFSSVFPGSSFARRNTALYNLIQVQKVFGVEDTKDSSDAAFRFTDVMSTNNIRVLLDCLRDSYDVNKLMAHELLGSCPEDRLPFQTPESLAGWLRRTGRLMTSPRAVDTLSASVLMRLLIDKCSMPLRFHGNAFDEKLSAPSNEGEPDKGVLEAGLLTEDFHRVHLDDLPCGQAFWTLCHLVLVLESHGAVAKESLSTAAIRAPMHGILFCQRSILVQLPFKDLANDRKWRHLVSRLLEVCLHIADLVSPVVASSSPEGHTLDEDQQDYERGGLDPDDVDPEGNMFAPAAQALLVCCWRTMKEVALLLGELAQQAPIMLHEEGDNGLLTPSQVRKIGKFFTVILLTSKHRGAFELAYTGFVKLCGRLWRSEDASLCALPQKWLRSLLQDITSAVPSDVMLCGTRRSAGVPFLVQAIVATEPPSACRACLKTVMKELMEMASKPVEKKNTTDSLLPQVHARNILRALFRDTRLGEHVFPFVSEGVAISLEGFLSDSWAVRNSSTLLFSALVTRIFGVKKTKDEDSRRNCMTGREFFSRFPDLHAFLLTQLKQACEAIEREGGIHPSLYPVLLILSRLYPSSMDGVDSALNMAPFVPYVIRCGKSSVMKTRSMAARAIVPLVSGVSLMHTLQDLIVSLPTSDAAKVNQNQVHGALLQILHLLQGHVINVKCTWPIVKQITIDFVPQLKQFTWISTRSNSCPITRSVFLEIASKLLVDVTWMNVPGTDSSEMTELTTRHVQPLREFFIALAMREAHEWNRDLPSLSASALVGGVFVKEIIARICLGASSDDLEKLSCSERDITANTTANISQDKRSESHDQQSRDVMSCDSRLVLATQSALIQTLLGSPEYEVRQIVLDYLSSRLRLLRFCADTNQELARKECDQQSEWLASEDQRAEVSVQLYEMALKSEKHPECLSKVFEVLCCLPEACVFPWKFKCGDELSIFQCWHFSASLISKEGQRAAMKCALLDFLATLIPQIYKMINSEQPEESSLTRQALRDFLDIVLSTSASSESVEVRLQTAKVLGRSDMRDVFLDSLKTLGDLPFRLWSVVVELLQDDDMSVREKMAEGVSRHLQKHTTADCIDLPTLATQKVLDTVLENFIEKQPGPCLHWILGLICGDVDSNSPDVDYDACADDALSSDVTEIERLFEKGSLNNYAEDCVVSRLAWEALKDTLQARHKLILSDVTEVYKLLVFFRAKTLAKIKSLCSTNLTSNAGVFSFVYRSLLGLLAVGRLESTLSASASPDVTREDAAVREQLVGFVGEISSSQESSGFSFHSILRTCLEELCDIHKVEITLSP